MNGPYPVLKFSFFERIFNESGRLDIWKKLRYIPDLYKMSFCWNVQPETYICNELEPTYISREYKIGLLVDEGPIVFPHMEKGFPEKKNTTSWVDEALLPFYNYVLSFSPKTISILDLVWFGLL